MYLFHDVVGELNQRTKRVAEGDKDSKNFELRERNENAVNNLKYL